MSNSYFGIASNSSLTTAAALGRYNAKSTSTRTRPATAKSCSGANYKKMPADLKRYSLKANSS